MSADCRVTVVLTGERVQHCLDKLAEHTPVSYRVIVAEDIDAGVRQADTEFVCLLDADVEVTDGWLPPLFDFMDAHPRAAAVAPVVLDESTQARDLFQREIDQAPAVCLLVRRLAFHEAGGYDADFAAALRRRGWQLWQCVRSTVVCARQVPLSLSDRDAPFRVLLIDDRVPQADRGRGDPRTMAVVDAWRAAHERARVTYFAALPDRAEEYAPALRDRGIEVVWGVDPAAWSRDRGGRYDVIVVFRPHNLDRAAEPIARFQPQAVLVYDSEALFHRRPEQHFEWCEDPDRRMDFAIEANTLRDMEVHAFNWADVAVCVSHEEAEWARRIAPATSVHVACYPVRVDRAVPGWEDRDGILFFGGFDGTPGTPNEFAVLELAGEVLPPLLERHPGTRLRVVGADPSPAVLALEGEHVTVLGKVPDPHPVLASALLHVVPMRYGAGVKIKFVDSMAAGLPFVTTPVGAEGLYLGPIRRHLVGASPAEIVELTDAMLTDRTLWTDMQGALLEICREHFSPDSFTAEMRTILAECGVAPASA